MPPRAAFLKSIWSNFIMSYLSQNVRAKMLKTVLDHAFKAKAEAAERALTLIGERIYNDIYGPHLAKMKSMPKEWFYESDSFSIGVAGRSHDVQLDKHVLLGHCEYRWGEHSKLYAGDEPIVIEYEKAVEAVEAIEKKRNTMSHEVKAILESVRTFKKLWEVWPEAKSILEKFENKPTAALLPAIQIDKVNAELGLPPDTNDIPWAHRLKANGGYEIGYFGPNGFVKTDEAATLDQAKSIVDGHNAA